MTDKELLDGVESLRVFVTSREKIKRPEGWQWFDELLTALRARLAEPEGEQKPAGYFVLTPEISVPPGGQPFPPIWIQVAVGREDEGTPLYRQPPTAGSIRQQATFKPDWNNYRQGLADGRAQAIEDCARVCDARAMEHKYGAFWNSRKGEEADDCAEAIRNLDKTRDIKEQP